MSTQSIESRFLTNVDEVVSPTEARREDSTTSAFPSETTHGSLAYSPAMRKSPFKERKSKPPLRRLTGFLLEFQGEDGRVAFVENGQLIKYDLPAALLRRSGIEFKNQPFQMDEIELSTDEGLVVGYRFQPLAGKSDAFIDTLDLDDDRKRKRDLILREFAEDQD